MENWEICGLSKHGKVLLTTALAHIVSLPTIITKSGEKKVPELEGEVKAMVLKKGNFLVVVYARVVPKKLLNENT